MYDPYAEFTKSVLPNGLEIHSASWDRPWIKMEVVVHSGAREDPVALPGLAHFVEHTVSHNIPEREFEPVKKFFETCGGWADFGNTYYLCTRYRFDVPIDRFSEALAIFGSMLLEARIEREVERERKVIFREFNEAYPFLEMLEWSMGFRRALFKGHRLETWNRPLGRPEGFLSITEVELQDFYDKHYVPSNMSLVIVGGLSAEQMILELEASSFGMEKGGVRNLIPQPFARLVLPSVRSETVRFSDYVSMKIDQAEYKATWAFPADFPHQARRVFSHVLSEILFDEIREKRGLAYSVNVHYTNFQDVYEYQIDARISPGAIPYINELVRYCIEMASSRRDVFDQKLTSLKQGCLMIDLSGGALAESSGAELASDHRIIPMQEVWDELHKVTFEQMAEAASFLSPEGQYTFISSP